MKLLFIRHGDPDYERDSLTEDGIKEAELLRERMNKMPLDGAFVSPLGRAALTAEIALKDKAIVPTECGWLREFDATIVKPDSGAKGVIWDLLPSYYAPNSQLRGESWDKCDLFKNSDASEKYANVAQKFDRLLCSLGYRRSDKIYKAEKPNDKTYAFFCHFGIESVILSHVFDISPYVLLQSFCALPTSVTEIVTEERENGIAAFRCLFFGDVSHLYAAGREPSFAARFCERFTDETRHN